ncbi:MAG TPA: histidine phosphatase family protein [Pyrinomonadaceae bacterium]|jgi:phosphohistidine phosphatase
MKTLLLLRHAKPENLAPGSNDSERKLTEAGRNQARALGGCLRQKQLKPDLVLCSPAARARETAELVISSAEQSCPLHYDPAIYESGPETLVQLVSQIDDSASLVLLVGHNPAIAELTTLLTNSVKPFSPGTMAKIDFDVSGWAEVTAGRGNLAEIVGPSPT